MKSQSIGIGLETDKSIYLIYTNVVNVAHSIQKQELNILVVGKR